MHPSLKILLLILLAILVQRCGLGALLLTGGLILSAALRWHVSALRKLLYRSRWLLLTLLLVYACTTPGEYFHGWESWPVTYEGVHQGVLQVARLAVMLAGLALLLGTTPREALMAGIFRLILPLRHLGLSPERFTARLWLTLHYVERERAVQNTPIWQRFDQVLNNENRAVERVRLEIPCFRSHDWSMLLVAVGFTFWSIA